MIHLEVLDQERKLFCQKTKIFNLEVSRSALTVFCVQNGSYQQTKTITEKSACFIFAGYLKSFSFR
jgi:hypothetical protein